MTLTAWGARFLKELYGFNKKKAVRFSYSIKQMVKTITWTRGAAAEFPRKKEDKQHLPSVQMLVHVNGELPGDGLSHLSLSNSHFFSF